MKSIHQILVAIDPGAESPAAPGLAARLAGRFGSTITLLGVTPELPWYARLAMGDPDAVERALADQEHRRLERIAGPLRDGGAKVEILRKHGRPALEVVREAIRGGYDLLIKDGAGGGEGWFTSADRQILRTCPCPVWLERPAPSRPRGDRLRIAALIDPAPLGTTPATPEDRESVGVGILDFATLIAEAEGGEVLAVHVWDATAQGLLRNCGYTEEQINAYVESVRAGVTRAVEHLLEPYRDRIPPEAVRLVRGIPTSAIPAFVEEQGIDLIVMGTMARSGIAGMVIGNTAESILGRAPCSLLAVKPEGFTSPVTLASQGEEIPQDGASR